MQYYFDIYFSSMQNFMINTAWKKIHGFCKQNDETLAIDLPRLVFEEEVEIIDLGGLLRVFGDKKTLERLNEEERFSAFINISGVKKTSIKECSEDEQYFVIKRDRSIDKKKDRKKVQHPHFIYEKDGNKIFFYIKRKKKKEENQYNSFAMLSNK